MSKAGFFFCYLFMPIALTVGFLVFCVFQPWSVILQYGALFSVAYCASLMLGFVFECVGRFFTTR